MARTGHKDYQHDWSDKAHLLARGMVYPWFFGVDAEHLAYQDGVQFSDGEQGRILDGEKGIDRIVGAPVDNFAHLIPHTVQERFRNESYAHFQDLTMTEINTVSGKPSEVYKIQAQLFLYGYVNTQATKFHQWLIVDIALLNRALLNKTLVPSKKEMNDRGQIFVTYKFKDLWRTNCVLMGFKGGKLRLRKEQSPQIGINDIDQVAKYFHLKKVGRPWFESVMSAMGI